MKYYVVLLVSISVFSLVKAKYDDQINPEEQGGNAYYDNEGPAHYQENQAPVGDNQRAAPNRPPQQQQPNPSFQNRAPIKTMDGQNEVGVRKVQPVANETFTLPPFYHSITTTIRTVKINRRTYAQLIETLVKDNALKTHRVIDAFHKVDRGYFVHRLEDEPYGFMARKLGRGVFMEKPHVQAKIIELLEPHLKEGGKVLDVGSGTGFMSCVFAELVGKTGKVYAVEHIKDQCEESWDTIHHVRPDLLLDGRLHIRCRDGRVGLPNIAPYDAIFFSTYVPDVPYSVLLQLKPGGRLICGIGKGKAFHRLVVIDKSLDGEDYTKFDMGVESFINPLCGAMDQNDNWLYQQHRRRIIEARNQGFSGMNLARKLRLYTNKAVDFRKLDDDTFKFIEV